MSDQPGWVGTNDNPPQWPSRDDEAVDAELREIIIAAWNAAPPRRPAGGEPPGETAPPPPPTGEGESVG